MWIRPPRKVPTVHGLLEDVQAWLILQGMADIPPVQHPIGLGTCCAHRRPLAGVEHAKVDAGPVRGTRHDATQGIDFLYQVTLADAANGRIAAHLAEGIDVMRKQQGTDTQACRCQRRLGAGMTTANDDDLELSCRACQCPDYQ
jgi:hypothetical protein